MGVGVGVGSSKRNKKRNIGVWFVLLAGLLLAAVAEGASCKDTCKRYRADIGEYMRCLYECDLRGHLHLKHFAGETQEGKEARGAAIPVAGAAEVKKEAVVQVGNNDACDECQLAMDPYIYVSCMVYNRCFARFF